MSREHRWDKNVIGQRFNRVIILSYSHTSKWRQAYFNVICDCGNTKVIRLSMLRNGHIKSCGCLAEEVCPTAAIKHGHSRDGKGSEYNSWQSMINRCYYEGNPKYHNYGGRGITVCDRWRGEHGFENFLADMGSRPSQKHTLDRKENNGNYEPSNCRWATPIEQHGNKRTNSLLTIGTETKHLNEWYRIYGVKGSTVPGRIKRGIDIHEALSMPLSDRIDNLKSKKA